MIEDGVNSLRLMIVAGEASGDAHAAALVHALRRQAPHTGFEFFGSTGAEMRAAGVESIIRSDDLAITGMIEVAGALPKFWQAYKALKHTALKRRPSAVVLVDWPDFNLRLARSLHRRGLKIIYYVSPQLWAWRAYRVHTIQRDVDLLLAILPFEPAWYRQRGVQHVEFVGHPLVGEVHPRYGRAEFCERHNLDPQQPIIALLPGSRRKELERILPVMLAAASILLQRRPGMQFVIPLAANRSPNEVAPLIDAASQHDSPLPNSLRITQGEPREALAASHAAAVASGTATLEAALIGTPLVVVYKESALNWHTLGRLINTEHFGLVNLIAGERIATELMQNEFTPARLADELTRLLNEEYNARFRLRLRAATKHLGAGGASEQTARVVLRAVRMWNAEDQSLHASSEEAGHS